MRFPTVGVDASEGSIRKYLEILEILAHRILSERPIREFTENSPYLHHPVKQILSAGFRFSYEQSLWKVVVKKMVSHKKSKNREGMVRRKEKLSLTFLLLKQRRFILQEDLIIGKHCP